MPSYLVTGATRGIGLELARQLVARGDAVIGTARDPDHADALRATGARVEALTVDDPASVAALGARLAGTAIDVLVNNAGIGGHGGGLPDLTAAELHRYLAINAIGPVLVTQALLPSLRAGRLRRIAHVSSLMGSVADNTSGGAYGYRASKAALNMFNRSLAHELGRDGFVCVVLNPGWVQTDMGGARAPLPVAQSVADLLARIDGLTAADSGRFFHHDGRELPW
ncbi:MAG: SDR family oxidoreductase [Kofleriaceae bacterium]|nr:SDR family oxidoreductase [Myxococcales bacterium]MCB9564865.1 SDR family oxidoreductase [Kofleriaceae bacterium]